MSPPTTSSEPVGQLEVHVDLDGSPVRAGVAYLTHGRRRVTTSFAYDPAYLADPRGVELEPALPRRSGQQYVDGLPGCFQDSAPDRWGRTLIDKRRRAVQRSADRRFRSFTDADYLLGVSDLTRQGDLRYVVDGSPFLDPAHDVPKLVALPRLLDAADTVDRDDDDLAAVKDLLDAGSGSLGGARPKASVRGDDGRLLIAKFPHGGDDWDVMAWECTALDLAQGAGLKVPGHRLISLDGRSVLLLNRFDRVAGGRRAGYLSAMSLLGARDGDERDYLDIADALSEHGAAVTKDLAELFRRMVLSVAVHNTDDHLRNHGFLRAPGGWRVSPVFDVNPDPDPGRVRSTSIVGAVSPDDEPEALLELASACRLDRGRAAAVIEEVCSAVRQWREVAARNGIGAAERERFADVIDERLAALRKTAP